MNKLTLKNIIKVLAAACVLLSITACANAPLQRNQTAMLQKGLAANQVDQLFGKAKVQLQHEFTANNKRYIAKHYNLQTGSRQQMAMTCTPICVPYFYPVAITVAYVAIYEAETQRLFAWGSVEELSRSPDQEISSIMPALKDSSKQAKSN